MLNEKIKVKIIDITSEGQGIGKITDGETSMVIFVNSTKDMVPVIFDEVEVEIVSDKKTYLIGRITEIIKPSPQRTETFCKHGGNCGGCVFHTTSYEAELEVKQKWIEDKLTRIGKIEKPNVSKIIGADDRLGYRNKAVLQIGYNKQKELQIGFFAKKSSQIVDIDECKIQAPSVTAVIKSLREIKHLLGERFEQVVVKTSVDDKSVMVDFVINKAIPTLPRVGKSKMPNKKTEQVLKLIKDPEEAVDVIYENLEAIGYTLASVYIEGAVIVAGEKAITEKIGNLNFEISPRSFYQVNTQMAEKLFNKVREFREEEPGTAKDGMKILDIYCGVGSIGLSILKENDALYGIEIVKEAIINANRNAVINGILSGMFELGKAEEVLPGNMEKYKGTDIVILDPPRTGCHKALIEAVGELAAEKLIYVSCDPATLGRDVKALMDRGYKFKQAVPVDMFPGTGHVECVVLMSRVSD